MEGPGYDRRVGRIPSGGRAKALALVCALGAGLVAPGLLWASDQVPGPAGQKAAGTTSPSTTTTAAAPSPPTTTTTAPPPPSTTTTAAPPPAPRASSSSAPALVVARAAASGGVTIQGFAFHPGGITVHTGDTVTWTNADSTQHTATANDGSFDTGTLSKGASGSHTFNTAGTFSYHCSIHPFMHGTITVVAASTGSSSSNGSSSSSGSSGSPGTTPSAATGSSSGSSLPNTGLELGGVALLGLALLGAGGLLRRLTTRLRRD
jgi:plastocyanin